MIGWLVGFNGMSNVEGYQIPNPLYAENIVWNMYTILEVKPFLSFFLSFYFWLARSLSKCCLSLTLSVINIYIYIYILYIYVCVCVCVCVERKKERKKGVNNFLNGVLIPQNVFCIKKMWY